MFRILRRSRRRRHPGFTPVATAPLSVQRSPVRQVLQAKLRVGAADDQAEREADAVADRVMRTPEPVGGARDTAVGLQRKCAECEQEEMQRQSQLQRQSEPEEEEEETAQAKPREGMLQRQAEEEKEQVQAKRDYGVLQRETTAEEEQEEETAQAKGAEGGPVSDVVNGRIQQRRGGGQPMPVGERAFFEPRFGTDFSTVRMHHDTEANNLSRAINARAFTLGNDIFFGAGEYRPGDAGGRLLMAHELTHSLQQGLTARRQIQRYRSSSSVNFGVMDSSTMKEKAFNRKTPDPYIDKNNHLIYQYGFYRRGHSAQGNALGELRQQWRQIHPSQHQRRRYPRRQSGGWLD